MIELLETLIASLAAVGLLAALYLIRGGGKGKRVDAVAKLLPAKWLQTRRVTEKVDSLPAARFLGVTMETYGAVFYALVLVALASQYGPLLWTVRVISVLVLIMSAYLVFALTKGLKRRCLICFMLNILNGLLAPLLWNLPNPR